jgi:hypothetical protein
MDPRKRNFFILGVSVFLALIATISGVIYWNRKSLFNTPPDGNTNRTLDGNTNITPDGNTNIIPDGNKETQQKGKADITELINKVLPKVEAFEAAELPKSEFSALMKQLDEIRNKATKDEVAANMNFFGRFRVDKSNLLERAVINTALKSGGNVTAIHNFAREHCSIYQFSLLSPDDFLIFPRIEKIPCPPYDEEYICRFKTLNLLFTIKNFIKSKGVADYLDCFSALNFLQRGKFHDFGYLSFFPTGADKFITDDDYSPTVFKKFLKEEAGKEVSS